MVSQLGQPTHDSHATLPSENVPERQAVQLSASGYSPALQVWQLPVRLSQEVQLEQGSQEVESLVVLKVLKSQFWQVVLSKNFPGEH